MIEIIPTIEIIEGKCVALSQGNYEQKMVYNENPLEVAKAFSDLGIQRLHLLDLDAVKLQHIVNYKLLEKIATRTNLSIDFAGGLKTDDDLRIAFECGASMITAGSVAVKSPDLFDSWIERYGEGKIILDANVKDEKIALDGWCETTDLELIPFVDAYMQKGIRQLICSDIDSEGKLAATSIDMYKKMMAALPGIYLIAGAGVASLDDIEILNENKIAAVIVGKALYEGSIKLKDLKRFFI